MCVRHEPLLDYAVIDTAIRASSSCECLVSTSPDTPRKSPDTPTLVRSSVLTEKPQKSKFTLYEVVPRAYKRRGHATHIQLYVSSKI